MFVEQFHGRRHDVDGRVDGRQAASRPGCELAQVVHVLHDQEIQIAVRGHRGAGRRAEDDDAFRPDAVDDVLDDGRELSLVRPAVHHRPAPVVGHAAVRRPAACAAAHQWPL